MVISKSDFLLSGYGGADFYSGKINKKICILCELC